LLNAQRSTLNAQRSTLNAQRSTLNAQREVTRQSLYMLFTSQGKINLLVDKKYSSTSVKIRVICGKVKKNILLMIKLNLPFN